MENEIVRVKESTSIGNLDNVCMFNFDDSVDFISWVLTIVQGETYSGMPLELSSEELDIPLFTLIGFPSYETDEENVCLISSARNNEQMWNLYKSGKVDSSSEVVEAMGEEKYILLGRRKNIFLYDWKNRRVPSELTRAFPYLEPIIMDLIKLRSSNPDMSQVKIFNTILEEVKNKYLNNGANKK